MLLTDCAVTIRERRVGGFPLCVMLCVPTDAPDACDMLLSVPPPKGWGGNSNFDVASGGGSWAREFRGRPRGQAGRQAINNSRDTRRISNVWDYAMVVLRALQSPSILRPAVSNVFCLFSCLSLFVHFSRLRPATRIYPTDAAWHSASGNLSARQPALLSSGWSSV